MFEPIRQAMGLPKKSEASDITSLLRSYEAGNERALDELMPLVYQQLKRIAVNQFKAVGPNHTLSPTALVNEAFLKLKGSGEIQARDRSHFFAVAAQTMRWILADHARAKKRGKRGGKDQQRVAFNENLHSPDDPGVELSLLAEALAKLEKQDPRLCRVVELRHLVGLTLEETAEALGVSTMTVKRDWVVAKAWLARELGIDD